MSGVVGFGRGLVEPGVSDGDYKLDRGLVEPGVSEGDYKLDR